MLPHSFTAILLAGTLPLAAGSPEAEALLPAEPEPFLTPNLDARLRYEFRNADPFEDAQALTARLRLGLLTREVFGFSAFAELETTTALIDDYRSNPADTSTSPHVANNTVIGDPENFELNQAWLRWQHEGLALTAGRQRIIRNNAAFVAHVGWRQNEQTYDALSLSWERENLSLFYAYSDRALRVFGDDANDAPPGSPLRDFEGEFHFLDGTLAGDGFTLGGYAYLIDVDNSATVGRSNSFGGFYKGDRLRAELAYQDGSSALVGGDGDYGAWFSHLTWNQSLGAGKGVAGAEYLQEHFRTPFALLHAFNGIADVFVQQRAGLNNANGAYEGLADLYLGYERPDLPGGITAKLYGHWFLDDSFGSTYGHEADLILQKSFSEHFSAIASAAWFIAEEGNGFRDLTQFTMELNVRY